jgi:hypothetical protein
LAPRKRRGKELSPLGFILTALVSIAVGAAAVFGYLAFSKPAPSPAADPIAAVTAPRGAIEELPEIVDDGSWTEEDRKLCRQQATAAADAADERRLLAVSSDRVGLGAPSAAMIERSAELLCNATSKPRHLCESYWRNQFLEAIKAYAADFRDVSTQAYWTNYNVAERARRAAAEDQAVLEIATSDLRQTTADLAQMHEEIVAAFQALIADGIIDPDDFGVFFGLGIPPDIAAMIGDARAVRHLCR